MTIEELTTIEKLNRAFYQASKASKWKSSTQRYHSELLLNNLKLQEELRNGTYTVQKTVNFWINERGKSRYIESPTIRDRIVQKVLTTEILIPNLTKPLIYDNYASLKGRGTSFARKRTDVMLRRFIKEFGVNGYVLLIDIKRYFPSIDHDILKHMIREKIHESKEIMGLIDYVIDCSSTCNKGLNLGSEAPQIFAVYYLNPIDTFCKTVKAIRYYGRYMDDILILSDKKEKLKDLLEEIRVQLAKLNLEINEQKTIMVKLSRGFTFLQIKYNISKDGKIIKRPTHKKVSRERKRLRKFRGQYDSGKMTELDIHNAYKSWRNSIVKDCNACYKTIKSTDYLYESLFPIHENYVRPKRNELLNEIWKENFDAVFRYGRKSSFSRREGSNGLH